jgi:hypothetical protein
MNWVRSVILPTVNIDIRKYVKEGRFMNRANESVLRKRVSKGLVATFAALCVVCHFKY